MSLRRRVFRACRRPREPRARAGDRARSAVIDVGSNTIHLLVGEVEDDRVLPVTGEKVSARLGASVDESGSIEEARISVAAEAIKLFARLATLNGASETTVLATSAVTEAANSPDLADKAAFVPTRARNLLTTRPAP